MDGASFGTVAVVKDFFHDRAGQLSYFWRVKYRPVAELAPSDGLPQLPFSDELNSFRGAGHLDG